MLRARAQVHAAIDLGSNTFRLLIARPRKPGEAGPPWRRVDYAHRIVRLGEGVHEHGVLGEAAMNRAIAAIRDFIRIMQHHGLAPETAHAVATAAMREAANGKDFCMRIARETGIRVRMIPGNEEAKLSLAGAAAVLSPGTRDDMLLFDIGGGSTEFIRARGNTILDAISRKLGVVRLTERFLNSDPPCASDYQAMKAETALHLNAVESSWANHHLPRHLVGTAGTVTTLAAVEMDLTPYDPERINNHVMTHPGFLALRDRLLALTHAERQAIPAIEPGRADLIIAGLAIIEAMLDCWHFDQLVTVDAGLLEGVWLQAVASSPRSPPEK